MGVGFAAGDGRFEGGCLKEGGVGFVRCLCSVCRNIMRGMDVCCVVWYGGWKCFRCFCSMLK